MMHINTILFKDIKLPLNGRNLVLTGKNGVGKTYFLTKLYEQLQLEFRDKYISTDDNIHSNKLKETISIFYNEFIAYSDILEINQKYIKLISNLASDKTKKNNQKLEELKKLQHIYSDNLNIFLREVNMYTTTDSLLLNNKTRRYYSAKPEHLIRSNDLLKKSLHELLSFQNFFKLIFNEKSTNNSTIISFFDVNSKLQVPEKILRMGNMYDVRDLAYYIKELDLNFDSDIEGAFERYLLEKRDELQNADDYICEEIYNTFNDIEKDLKLIFDDETTTLSFDDFNKRVLILQRNENISFGFDELPSGFKSIFKIYSNFLIKSKLIKTRKNKLNGIVLIDEIDSHLHISLQQKVLPFFTSAFPNIQFIVSTHSPFVITSTDSNTVVYDVSTKEFVEEDLSRYSYESVIKGLFHVEVQSEKLASEIKAIAEILNNEPNSYEKLRNILKNITPFLKQLDVESKSFYFKALNHLLDNQELGDLDV